MKTTKGVFRIGYAEDHTIVRRGITSLLTSDPCIEVIIEAQDGMQLIEHIETATVLPDICIMDINMPRMNGVDCVAYIRKCWPTIKVLVLTALTDDAYVIRMIKAGANGYLAKGCDISEIRMAMSTITTSGYYFSGAFSKRLINQVHDSLVKLPDLTAKELEVLKLSMSDLAYPEIAKELNISIRSVQGFRDSLFRKLEVHNRASLVVTAIKMGLLIV
jgi:two-component system, NarL family, invasion response regulator UvrY